MIYGSMQEAFDRGLAEYGGKKNASQRITKKYKDINFDVIALGDSKQPTARWGYVLGGHTDSPFDSEEAATKAAQAYIDMGSEEVSRRKSKALGLIAGLKRK